jgi:hypothetical protein
MLDGAIADRWRRVPKKQKCPIGAEFGRFLPAKSRA